MIVQDPCHLRHVQRAEGAVRRVLARYVDVVELDDDGLCCGAGGAYSALQPELAATIRERKLAAIERAGGAAARRSWPSANPGCAMHLGAGRRRRPAPDGSRRRGDRRGRVSRYAELAARLRDIAGELDDAALDVLNRAVADGATARPAEDKALTQARRAVEKAATLLESLRRPNRCVRVSASERAATPACVAGERSERVEHVDHRPQVAVLVLGELEADARQVDAIGLADLDGQRLRALDPP